MKLTSEIAQPIIKTLEEALPFKITIIDDEGYIVGSSDISRINKFHPSAYEIICGRAPIESLDQETGTYINIPEVAILGYGAKIEYEGKCIGIVGLIGPPEEMKKNSKTVQLLIRLYIDAKNASDELALIAKDKQSFILSLLRGEHGSGAWYKERAGIYGVNLGIARYLVVIRMNLSNNKDPLGYSREKLGVISLLRSIFPEPDNLICDYDSGDIVLLTANFRRHSFSGEDNLVISRIDKFFKIFCERHDMRVVIGISEECMDYTHIPDGFRQARIAASVGGKIKDKSGVYYWNDIRLGRIVSEFTPNIRKMLNNDIIEKLEGSNDCLVETLETYFENNLNVTLTSQQLHIHRNSLQYRLNKIRNITGFSVYDVDSLVLLRLATLQRHFKEEEI